MSNLTLQDTVNWWQSARLGMFIHWGIYALPARNEWVKCVEKMSNEDYQKYFDHFEPDLFEPRTWAKMARSAGMKYFVITTKHHDGFCLWNSKHTDYKITNTPCGKDLLKEIVVAFRAEGLKVGFYYSLLDWHHEQFIVDRAHPQRDCPEAREKNQNRDLRKYSQYMRDQVTELLTEFGHIDILWFDYTYSGKDGKGADDWDSPELLKLVRSLQPHILVNNRLGLPDFDFVTPEQYLPVNKPKRANGLPIPWEGCHTLNGDCGYSRDKASYKSPQILIEMLINHVSRGGNLLMNVGPNARGEFNYHAVAALETYADWMKYHCRAIYNCTEAPKGIIAPNNCCYTYNPETRRLYLHLLIWPFKTIHLPDLEDKVKYAQLLNDGSEIKMRQGPSGPSLHAGLEEDYLDQALTLELPEIKPPVIVPVIELFLK